MKKPVNHFEHLVQDILRQFTDNEDALCDAMAMALNDLPPRYYCRPEVLARMKAAEQEDLRFLAETAVRKALAYVRQNPTPQKLWDLSQSD
jgi:hypothetical protein